MRLKLSLYAITALVCANSSFAQSVLDGALDLPSPRLELSDSDRAQATLIGAPEVNNFVALTSALPDGDDRSEIYKFAAEQFRNINDEERVVITNIEPLLDKSQRGNLALVTLYRYRGNETVQRLVDIGAGTLISERTSTSLVPSLAPIEASQIETMVQSNAEIQSLLSSLGASDATIEALVIATTSSDDPLFGRRVAEVQFKTERGYVSVGSRILVDLTDNEILKE